MRRARFIALGGALGALLVARGAEAATKRPVLAPFDAIRVSGVAHVAFTQAPVQTIIVTAAPDLLRRLHLTVVDGVLNIGMTSGTIFGNDGRIMLAITAPVLTRFDVAGVATGSVRGLTAKRFALHLSGTGSFDLQGHIEQARVSLSGAGSIDASRLIARDLTVRISGAGSVRAYADHEARISVSGVGSARIAGHPPERHVSRSGVGSIRFD